MGETDFEHVCGKRGLTAHQDSDIYTSRYQPPPTRIITPRLSILSSTSSLSAQDGQPFTCCRSIPSSANLRMEGARSDHLAHPLIGADVSLSVADGLRYRLQSPSSVGSSFFCRAQCIMERHHYRPVACGPKGSTTPTYVLSDVLIRHEAARENRED